MAQISLPDLPSPDVIETISLEGVLEELRTRFLELFPQHDAFLESDPAHKLLEVSAYREIILRQRVNDAARANLLAFATGGDLDHLAAFYDVVRLDGETDDALRARTVAAIMGRSNAGTAQAYRFFALSAHPDIEDAGVSAEQSGELAGLVTVALLPALNADQDAILEAATAVLTGDAVRAAVDTMNVVIADEITVNVTATVWLQTGQPAGRLDEIQALFRTAFNEQRGLGWDVTRSWVTAALHRGGVYKVTVTAPASDVVVGPGQYPELGTIALTLGGTGF